MDFREFRSRIVKVPFAYEGEEFWVGYRPREILEEDLEQLAWLQRVKLDINIDALPDPDPAPPNRAQRRQTEKAERVAKATPRGKPEKPVPTMIDHMKHLIADWSLTWDGEPWPACEENFKTVEPLMRMAMIRAVVEDYLDRPNRMSSSTTSSEETASGPTGQMSASEPSNGEIPGMGGAASSPGI